MPEILGWLGKHARQTGPVFFNYTRMDGGKMEMEVGAPVAAGAKGDDRVKIGTLPGGRYVTATWTGPYDRLHGAHMQLHDWLARQNLHPVEASGRTTLLEVYITDPDEVADPRQWVTDLVFRLGD